jgi:glycosyltransferase involved in cell wall biosynthesis
MSDESCGENKKRIDDMANITDVLLQTKGGIGKRPQKIMVFDVAAETGGALSVLQDFYDELKNRSDLGDVQFFFVLSTIELPETRNIHVLRFPWVKKGWGHRFFFDHIIAPRLVAQYNIDTVFSLQNLTIPHIRIPQVVFLHQALPFSEHRFGFFENTLFWTYQNIIGKMILKSIRNAETVIVQTQWMKKECIKQTGENEEKIAVIAPALSFKPTTFFQPAPQSFLTFFYPATELLYKNHKAIIDACIILKEENVNNYKVFFTFSNSEDPLHYYDIIKKNNLSIYLKGKISRSQVFDFYTKSILIFPSYLESYALPLKEGLESKCIILASNCSFSHEILDGYQNAFFFDPFKAHELSQLMKNLICGNLKYSD